MKIAILGGGHGCYAAAADLSEQGHEVRLWRRDAAALQPVIDHGGITLKDAQGRARCRGAGHRRHRRGAAWRRAGADAVAGHRAGRHRAAMAPHLVDGQVVFLAPGTFGAFTMSRIVKASGNRPTWPGPRPARCPTWRASTGRARSTSPSAPSTCPPACTRRARPIGRWPSSAGLPGVHGCGDALSGALMNAGPIIHPPLMVMNAAPLQHFPKWDIHTEGTQPAVRAVTDRLDQERIAVREALGYGAPHYPLADHYDNDRWMYGDAHKKLQKSGDWREHIDLHTHRYVTEDTELGLAFLASVARWAGTDAPIAQGLLAITGGFLGRDLRRGRARWRRWAWRR
jgi:opine dehydrogenase